MALRVQLPRGGALEYHNPQDLVKRAEELLVLRSEEAELVNSLQALADHAVPVPRAVLEYGKSLGITLIPAGKSK